MNRTILTFPLRASWAGTRVALRATGDVAVWTLKLGARTAVAATEVATRAATRASNGGVSDRPAPPPDVSAVPADEPDTAASELDTGMSAPDIAAPQPDTGPPSADVAPLQPEAPGRVREGLPDEPEPVPEPAHVSEEPELVEEFAEPGAEEGAGASIEIAEPWPGYRALDATELIAGFDDATPAELAAIELYETANRNRQTVLDAAQRSLKTKTGRASPDPTE